MMIFSKKILARVALALALGAGLATSARADSIRFDPDGAAPGNPAYTINGLGFGAGNALAVSAIPLTSTSTFQIYFQTHLTSLTGPLAPAFVPGLNSTFQITEVATFTETVTSLTTTAAGTTATFAVVPNANNKINIYYSPTVSFNDAAGTGFTMGQIIATLTPSSFISSQFTVANLPPATFNQTGAGNNSGSGLATQGSGSTNLLNGVASYDKLFFQPTTGLPTLTTSIFNSNLNSVFDAVSPSLLFTSPNGGAPFAPNIGAINGLSGPDFQLQVSGFTQSFSTAVPEPASVAMTLIGLGGAGLFSFAARRRRARATA